MRFWDQKKKSVPAHIKTLTAALLLETFLVIPDLKEEKKSNADLSSMKDFEW